MPKSLRRAGKVSGRRKPSRGKKSWQQKLADNKDLPKVMQSTNGRFGGGTFVIPAPLEVDAIMQRVPRGRLITIDLIRAALAQVHGTDSACPITTGIFAWIAAHAADELEQQGRRRITPYWRTLKAKGEVNAKYPGGIAGVRQRLEAEGHTIVKKREKYFVVDFESRCWSPSLA